jgi:hypothetical protein
LDQSIEGGAVCLRNRFRETRLRLCDHPGARGRSLFAELRKLSTHDSSIRRVSQPAHQTFRLGDVGDD